MENMTLSDVLEKASQSDNGLSYRIPPNWAQGRTAYGGFTAALLLHAAQKSVNELSPLRSAMINFTGPIAESPLLSCEVLRQGKNFTSVEARARIGNEVVAAASLVFGGLRNSEVSIACEAVPVTMPEQCHDLGVLMQQRFPIVFMKNFELRHIEGGFPFTASSNGYMKVWARHRDEYLQQGVLGLLSIADILPPAISPMLSQPASMSSINWMCNVLTDHLETRDGWWVIETKVTAGQGGFSSQVMRVWNSENTLVLDAMQSVAIFI